MRMLNEILKHNYSNDFNYLANHYKFDKSHHDDLDKFTGSSMQINSSLWNSRDDHHRQIFGNSETNNRIKRLDSVLSLHKTPQEMTVYSGSQHDPRKMKNSEGIVHHPAYLSTSLKRNIAQGFANSNQTYNKDIHKAEKHLYKIKVPQGSSGAFVGHHGIAREEEFILPRGTNLKHEKTESKETPTKIYHTHHMSVVK